MKASSLALVGLCILALAGCATSRKIENIRNSSPSVVTKLPAETDIELPETDLPPQDTLTVTGPDGRQMIIMRAIRDDETGDMVATEELRAAVVVSRFRNVAERGGLVDLEFQVIVGDSLQDSHWQLRFTPEMYVLEDTLQLDPIYITGEEFRKTQLRGYQHYNRFLASIARDSTYFVDEEQVDLFFKRYAPELYAFKTDSSRVSEAEFAAAFGISQQEALEHYTRHLVKQANARRVGRSGRVKNRYVKNPILESGIRLDTVVHTAAGDFIYNYVQTIHTRPGLRKVGVVIAGDIYGEKGHLYSVPPSEPLTFYISSLSSFVDNTPRYRMQVISRRVSAATSCNLAFDAGKSNLDPLRGENASEMERIRTTLYAMLDGNVLELDSIVITASCSPDGAFGSNARLARERSRSVTGYFEDYISEASRQIVESRGLYMNEAGEMVAAELPQIRFISRSIAEDWAGLDALVEMDTVMTHKEKAAYWRSARIADPDRRETSVAGASYYKYARANLYPSLRAVRFDFHLHRRDMVQDTVWTSVVDTAYMNGVQLLSDHYYEDALALLEPYQDYNTAVAYLALGRNESARAILGRLPSSARISYMMAIIESRRGNVREALQHFVDACAEEPSYKYRGNLDPEIAAIIKNYDLDYSLPASFL